MLFNNVQNKERGRLIWSAVAPPSHKIFRNATKENVKFARVSFHRCYCLLEMGRRDKQ